MKIIYLHGFNSAYDPDHEKIQHLSELEKVEGITYNTFSSYNRILRFLLDRVDIKESPIIIGTSLGGCWAGEIARKTGLKSVMINPGIDPCQSLKSYIDINLQNFRTGVSNCLVQSVVDSYKDNELSDNKFDDFTVPPFVLLDRGDEILSTVKTQNRLSKFPKKIFSGGTHSFAHIAESIPYIRNYIRIHNIVGK